eukprot:g4230.t1
MDMHREEAIRDAFAYFDVHGDGRMPRERLVVALQSMGALMSTEQMRTVEEAAVVDDDGMVSYDDFRLALDKFAVQHPDDERVRLETALGVFDPSARGVIDVAELKQALTRLSDAMTPKDVDKIINDIDPQGTGSIDTEEFCEMLINVNARSQGLAFQD